MTKKQRRQMRSRERRKNRLCNQIKGSPTNPQLSPKKSKIEEKPKYNTACDFCTVRDGQCHCKIKMDTYFCSENCAFATNNPVGLPPYGTKYMKGGKL